MQPRPAVSTPQPARLIWARIVQQLRWTETSFSFLIGFMLIIFAIVYFWWPLAVDVLRQIDWNGQWWEYFDWLLLGDFVVMTLLLMAGADMKRDSLIILVGAAGGLVIESWGTQTHIWTYYTLERPPLWIIPAWPIASLAIDRIVRIMNEILPQSAKYWKVAYWLIFPSFFALMLFFVWPTVDKAMTLAAIALCVTLILSPKDHRMMVLTFAAGSGLGYFLELWGTTRLCWTYYTHETPPLFAVLAHGMAAVAFWRSGLLAPFVLGRLGATLPKWPLIPRYAKREAEEQL
jgi:hypothetical protein